MIFNVPGDPIREIVAGYRSVLDSLATPIGSPSPSSVRDLLGGKFTRGHFARAV
jgi:U32 family peptidase